MTETTDFDHVDDPSRDYIADAFRREFDDFNDPHVYCDDMEIIHVFFTCHDVRRHFYCEITSDDDDYRFVDACDYRRVVTFDLMPPNDD